MSNEFERRVVSGRKIEVRADGDSHKIRGYAAVFDVLSENLGGFREKIEPGAFADVLDDDVRALLNHNSDLVLGRTSAKTLTISQDAVGLRYEIDPPDTQVARDLMVSIKRGDIDQSSFAFRVEEDDWIEDDEGRVIRTILKVKELRDVSPVTYPAYPDASVGVRSMDAWKQSRKPKGKPTPFARMRARLRMLEID